MTYQNLLLTIFYLLASFTIISFSSITDMKEIPTGGLYC